MSRNCYLKSSKGVHIEVKMENFVKNEWVYHLYLSPFRGNQRGVMVLMNNTFEYDLGRIKKDQNGNFIIIVFQAKK